MRGTGKTRNGGYGLIVLIVLVAALLFGFVFDFAFTRVEYAVYKKPDQYQGFVTKYSAQYGVPENLIYAVIKTESGFDPAAVSDEGAVGLMQITEVTFDDIRVRLLSEGYLDAGMRYDPETNIRYGTRYLGYLFERFKSWDLAIVAYFEGESRVAEWIENGEISLGANESVTSLPKGFGGGERYLKKVNKSWQSYDRLYGK